MRGLWRASLLRRRRYRIAIALAGTRYPMIEPLRAASRRWRRKPRDTAESERQGRLTQLRLACAADHSPRCKSGLTLDCTGWLPGRYCTGVRHPEFAAMADARPSPACLGARSWVSWRPGVLIGGILADRLAAKGPRLRTAWIVGIAKVPGHIPSSSLLPESGQHLLGTGSVYCRRLPPGTFYPWPQLRHDSRGLDRPCAVARVAPAIMLFVLNLVGLGFGPQI